MAFALCTTVILLLGTLGSALKSMAHYLDMPTVYHILHAIISVLLASAEEQVGDD
jgi:hypothetical protein